MRSKSGAWSLLALVAASIGLVACAGSAPPPKGPSPAAAASPVAAPAFASAADARARLLQLEDRRSYDAAALGAAARFPDPAVRAHAALAIGRIGDERGRDVVRGMLADGSPEVRGAAAFACQLLEDGSATPDLIRLLSDPDPRVAGSAAQAIGALGRGDGQDALIAAIPRAAAPEPRAAMLSALWRFADEQSAAAALAYASDPDARVRSAALYTLSRKPIETSRAALTAALGDSDPDTAAGAARALGILGKSAALEPLAATLDSGKPHLVTSSLNALEAILEKNPGTALAPDRRTRVIALAGDANPNLAIPALVLLRQFVASDRESLQRVWSIATTGPGRRRQVALQSAVASMRDRAKAALDLAVASPDARLCERRPQRDSPTSRAPRRRPTAPRCRRTRAPSSGSPFWEACGRPKWSATTARWSTPPSRTRTPACAPPLSRPWCS